MPKAMVVGRVGDRLTVELFESERESHPPEGGKALLSLSEYDEAYEWFDEVLDMTLSDEDEQKALAELVVECSKDGAAVAVRVTVEAMYSDIGDQTEEDLRQALERELTRAVEDGLLSPLGEEVIAVYTGDVELNQPRSSAQGTSRTEVSEADAPLFNKPIAELINEAETAFAAMRASNEESEKLIRTLKQEIKQADEWYAAVLKRERTNPKLVITAGDKALAFVALFVICVVPYALATVAYRPPAPVYSPDITVEVDPNRIAASLIDRAEFDPSTGLFTPLPPEAEDADVFRQACNDVCRADGQWVVARRGEEPIEPRVLVNDPEHRVCTCLTGTHIRRYVDWRRTSP